ncbi:MAG: hypothetical protein U9N12_03350 [Euryarchaeota archaeon]|nr:hypothetical protein [Euryarchaeota archaeon]
MQPILYPDLSENCRQDLPSEIAEANIGYVKIFKYMPGARITGTAPPNSTAMLSIPILTNQARTFEYVRIATATSDGVVTPNRAVFNRWTGIDRRWRDTV